jgi:hypothetical protein
MLGWFSARCPLDTGEKAWTEMRLRWLADQFGIDRLLHAEVVLPTDEYFPDSYQGTADDARRMLDRLCYYLSIDPMTTELDLGADSPPGVSVPTRIRVEAAQLADPRHVVAVLARELSRKLLVERGLATGDDEDHEGVAELLTVFLGVGVFAANVTLSEEYGHVGEWNWWTIRKQGYLPARVFGYAFALFAWVRGEEDPAWATFLRPDAAAALREGLRYLHRTGDSLFHPETLRQPRRPLRAGELVERIQTGTPSFRLAALVEIRDRAVTDPAVVTAVIECLEDADRAIPAAAARALAVLGPAAGAAGQLLCKALGASEPATRAAAAHALGALRLEPATAIPELDFLLEDRNPGVVAAAAEALRRYGPAAEVATRRLLTALRVALIDCSGFQIDALAGALLAVTPDARRQVRDFFTGPDLELRRFALEALRDQRRQGDLGQANDDQMTR